MKRSAKTNTKKPAEVELGGDLTIRGVKAAHERLLAALNDNSSLAISIADDASIDLTAVQLITAARHQAKAAGGELIFTTPAPTALLEVLKRGGFLEAADSREFWLGAGE